MSKMTVGDFEHQNRKMKKVSKGMDTVLRIVWSLVWINDS